MTTDRRTSTSGLVRVTAATAAAGGVLVAVAALVSGSAAAYGAFVGALIAVGIFGFGAFTVDTVARIMPSASLLVAMVTYALQIVLLALVLIMINGSGLIDDELNRNWLGGAIVLGTVVWMGVQLRLATTARIPAFETPAPARIPACETSGTGPRQRASTPVEGGPR